MRRGSETLLIQVSQEFRLHDDFHVQIQRYIYVLWSSKKNERIIDWHYHRRQNQSFEAHLHVRDDAKSINHPLVNRHVPTGWVPLDDVIKFMIEELGIAPRIPNWKEVLKDAADGFNQTLH